MSSIRKLQILGIRSFGPDQEDLANVSFLSPLTLILGQNGCGKTTIIEALKFVTSGDPPANSGQGSAFVHDPKMSNSVEVRGQVKLIFNNVKGDQVCVARSVQVLQNLKKLTFKSLDQTITLYNRATNQKESISGRCADIDSEMCIALGVSKPILHYVIFCHQEDSCWPLEDGKKLKEKFDAIFDATKYNRCLEHIRKERKEAKNRLKLLGSNLHYLKKFEDEAQSKRKLLEETQGKLAQTKDSIKAFEEQLGPINTQLKEINLKENNIAKVHQTREGYKADLKHLRRSRIELSDGISTVFVGSNFELEEAIRKFEDNFREKKNILQSYETQSKDLSSDMDKIQDQIETQKALQGELKGAELSNQKKITERNRDITILAKKLSLQAPNISQLTDTGPGIILEEIEAKVKEGRELLEVTRISQEDVEKEMQRKMDSARTKEISFRQEIKSKEKQLKDTDEEYIRVTSDIHDADQSANTLSILENRLERINSEIAETEKGVNVKEVEQSIKERKEEKYQLEDIIKSLEKELDVLRILRDDQNRLDKLKEDKLDLDTKIRKLRNKHSDTLQHLLGEIPDQGIQRTFNECLGRLKQDIKNKNEALNETNKSLLILKTNRKHKAEKLNELQADLTEKKNQIYDITQNEDFETILNDIAEKIQEQQDIKGTWVGTEYLYKRYIQKLQQTDPCCPLCHRNFDQNDEAEDLIVELNSNLQKIPVQRKEVSSQLDKLLIKQSKLLQLKPVYEKMKSLTTIEIPALMSELDDLETKIKKLQQEQECLQNDLIGPQSDEALAESALNDIISLDQLSYDSRKLERNISDQEAKLGSRSKGASYEQVNNDCKQKKEDLEKINKTLEFDQTKLQIHIKTMNQLAEKKNEIVHEQLELRSKSQRRAELGEKQNELQTLKVTLRAELDDMNDQLQPLSLELASLVKELRDKQIQHRKLLDEERNQVQTNEGQLKEILKLQREIINYEANNGAAKLAAVEDQLNDLKKRKENLDKERGKLNDSIKELEKFVFNLTASRQDLERNKQLREKDEEEEKLLQVIETVTLELKSMDYETLKEQKSKLLEEDEDLKRKKAQAQGRASELESKINDYEKELKSANYKNAETNYKNKLIELKTEEMAVEDLGNYCIALDWAMIHFHKERMKTINTIVRNLWRQIYSGNDIDMIEIKTEEFESLSADAKRTYNYRVVCQRGGVELDMRGRCSAGQKVLASLIIRMALAETFSKNCGVLTLDEPTTNLDQENIESLCTALAEIVAVRSKQKNFQLIIITHDEDFIMRLSQVEKIPFYLKVQRNRFGKSEVLQVPFS